MYILTHPLDPFAAFDFYTYLVHKVQEGLHLESFSTGWLGWLIAWIVQIWLTVQFSELFLASSIAKYSIKKVPVEVLDFAMYHFENGKTEAQVRAELSLLDWSNKQYQDDVIEAVGTMYSTQRIHHHTH